MKNSIKSSLSKASSAVVIKRPFLPNLAIKSLFDKVFERLHLPPPVAFILEAILESFSKSKTFLPSLEAFIADIIPLAPAPITIKSYI